MSSIMKLFGMQLVMCRITVYSRHVDINCTRNKTAHFRFNCKPKNILTVAFITIITCIFILRNPVDYNDYRKVPYSKCALTNTSNGYIYKDTDTVFAITRDFKQISDKTKLWGVKLKTTIAIGVAITSKNVFRKRNQEIDSLVFFTTLMPSFCKTASNGYHYNFFLAYDQSDTFFNSSICSSHIYKVFNHFTAMNCPRDSEYSIWFVRCKHNGHPAKAQNDVMMVAYMSDMEYYYRINDDTTMKTSGWTETFITALQSFDPPNVGVVGPNHTGGNTDILTYEFVHYTHIEIFGYYYPRLFSNWFADSWITNIYSPQNMLKLENISLEHTQEEGTRYYMDPNATESDFALDFREIYLRYVGFKRSNKGILPEADQVISMGISEHNARYYFGAIRNAQLRLLYFPDWTLRIYLVNNTYTKGTTVPRHVIDKLKKLGAQIIIVNSSRISENLVQYLVIDDTNVARFLIRNADHRISLRDSMLTSYWLKREHNNTFCIHDILNQSRGPIVSGLFGANNKHLNKLLGGITMKSVLEKNTFHDSDDDFINSFLWPKLKHETKCYTSHYDKETASMSIAFPPGLDRFQNISLGTVYNEFGEIVKS